MPRASRRWSNCQTSKTSNVSVKTAKTSTLPGARARRSVDFEEQPWDDGTCPIAVWEKSQVFSAWAKAQEKGFLTQKMACACVPESLRVVPSPVQGCAKNVSLPVCSSDLSLLVSSARGRQVRGSRQGVKLLYISATLGRQDKDSGKTSEGPAASSSAPSITATTPCWAAAGAPSWRCT
jgi:hypothetical protein